MESLSFYSEESTWATAIKNALFVEANVMNNSTKIQRNALMASEEMSF